MRENFVGDDTIVLPVTFDYRGGRAGNLRGMLLYLSLSLAVLVVLSLVIFSGDERSFIVKLIYFFVLLVLYSLFLRFFVFKEKVYRRRLEKLSDVSADAVKDGKEDMTSNSYWGIFDISDTYPHECFYVDGKRSIFVSLSKDIFIGKGDEVISRHYDSIADAFNIAYRNQVDLVSIDYMDTVGNDTRMSGLYSELAYSSNEKLKYSVGTLYKSLIDDMEGEFVSYDVYCIVTSNAGLDLYKVVMQIVTALLEGNYVSYKILNESAIRQLCSVLTNNEDFSLLKAQENVLNVNNYRNFKPLFVVDSKNMLKMIKEDGQFEDSSAQVNYEVMQDVESKKDIVDDNEEFDIF